MEELEENIKKIYKKAEEKDGKETVRNKKF